jgi:hypothetical protein
MARESFGRLTYSVWHCLMGYGMEESISERVQNAWGVLVHWYRNDVQED